MAEYVVSRDEDGVHLHRDGKAVPWSISQVDIIRAMGKPTRIEIRTAAGNVTEIDLELGDVVRTEGWEDRVSPPGDGLILDFDFDQPAPEPRAHLCLGTYVTVLEANALLFGRTQADPETITVTLDQRPEAEAARLRSLGVDPDRIVDGEIVQKEIGA